MLISELEWLPVVRDKAGSLDQQKLIGAYRDPNLVCAATMLVNRSMWKFQLNRLAAGNTSQIPGEAFIGIPMDMILLARS
jgi:hypothetical protein